MSDLLTHFSGGYSRVYLSKLVNQLVKDGKLLRSRSTRSARYASKQHRAALGTYSKKRFKNQNIEEDRIYQGFERELPFIQDLPNICGVF